MTTCIHEVSLGTYLTRYHEPPGEKESVFAYPYTSLASLLQALSDTIVAHVAQENANYAKERASAAQRTPHMPAHEIRHIHFSDQRHASFPPLALRLSYVEQVCRTLLRILFRLPLLSTVLLETHIHPGTVDIIIGWASRGALPDLYEDYLQFAHVSTGFVFIEETFALYLVWQLMQQCQGRFLLDIVSETTYRATLAFPRRVESLAS